MPEEIISTDSINLMFQIIILFKDSLLGFIGGALMYLFIYQKNNYKAELKNEESRFKFRFSSLIISALLGSFIAYICGNIIPPDLKFRDSIIGLSGLLSYQIMALIESSAMKYILNRWVNTPNIHQTNKK